MSEDRASASARLMPTQDVGTCILFEPKLRGGSEIPLRYRSVFASSASRLTIFLASIPSASRREGGDHAMREHGDGHRVDIFEPDHVAAEQGRAGLGTQDQVLDGSRTGPPRHERLERTPGRWGRSAWSCAPALPQKV